MKFFSFCFIALSIIGAASCSKNIANAEEVKSVDSVLFELNRTITALDTVDVQGFDVMLAELEELNTEAFEYFEPTDTAKYWKREIGQLMLCIKSLERYEKESVGIAKTLNENKLQLENLKHDLEKGFVESSKIEEYMHAEFTMTTQALTIAAKRGGRALYCLQNYDSIVDNAKKIILQLKAND